MANLTALPAEALEVLKHTLRQPMQARALRQSSAGATAPAVTVTQGLSIGAVATVYQVAQTLGICQVLGNSPQGKLALWQVMAGVIQPGSCLASVRLAREHAACDLVRVTDSFCEDDLYTNLAWLSERQLRVEKALFRRHATAQAVELFLYDVTSSYLEGEHNVLGAYGYCRDKKRGKPQIVVGLLTDAQGEPVSVEVFRGNTSDVSTLTAQVRKLAQAFGCRHVTLVGDRGLSKQVGIEAKRRTFTLSARSPRRRSRPCSSRRLLRWGCLINRSVRCSWQPRPLVPAPSEAACAIFLSAIRCGRKNWRITVSSREPRLKSGFTTTTRNWRAAPVPNWAWPGGNCSATLPSSSLRGG